jgi:hypothetical protein
MMTIPKEAAPWALFPAWIGYIKSGDIDGDTEAVAKAGGKVSPSAAANSRRRTVLARRRSARRDVHAAAAGTARPCRLRRR